MALTVVPSTRVFNGNVGTQAYVSGSTGSKCLCCPYGYHIDLDFVRYCEAVAAGSAGDRSGIERRKKRERRRQCQSMEVLLGLVSPALVGIEAELPKIPQEPATPNGVSTLPRSSHDRQVCTQESPVLDLSDVVGDFEATLRRSIRSTRTPDKTARTEHDGTIAAPVQVSAQTEHPTEYDNASIGSGNSNLSTGALQNIREQMATSLERMKELEEQVKVIPVLQVQVSVLKEEKRTLIRRLEERSKAVPFHECTLHRHRSRSFSEHQCPQRLPRNTVAVQTRDMGTMCGVLTRDVGVSHQQVRTRDVGMLTSTPIKQSLQRSQLQIEEIVPEIKEQSTLYAEYLSSTFGQLYWSDPRDSWRANLTCSQLMFEDIPPRTAATQDRLKRSPMQIESIPPERPRWDWDIRMRPREVGPSTRDKLKNLVCSHFIIEDIAPEPRRVVRNRCNGTLTNLTMAEIMTKEEIGRIVDDAVKIYKETITKNTISRGSQCTTVVPKIVEKKDQYVQVTEPFKLKTSVGVTAKPKVVEVGVGVMIRPGTRSIGVGPDPPVAQSLSLNSMNSRSHSFNYGDTKTNRMASKSVSVVESDLIKTAVKSTDTSDLIPKTRDFGTSTIKKTFVDASVGESSAKSPTSTSSPPNYCDSCKENVVKSLSKQVANNPENTTNHANLVSRIPRPSHILFHTSMEHKKQNKRQETYSKTQNPGVIKYDTDNKEHYDNNRIQQFQAEKEKDEKLQEIYNAEKQTHGDEKHELPESALFQPIQEKPRKKIEPSKEMQAAMKVLNDSLKKSPSKNISHQIKNATNIIQQDWFKISSTTHANPLEVEDYLDYFEEGSSSLLEYIVNMTDSTGNTAMHYAVSHGNFDVVSILLDSKVCDINKANAAGYTAVMLAALAEVRNSTHASVANRLFQLADVNIRAKLHGQTALMLAVSHGRKDMTQLLMDAGAAVNIQDEDGSTALMCAAEHGHTDIVRLLLTHPDCDPSIVDIDGSSALKIALEAGNRDIGVLLYAHERVNRGSSPYSSMRRNRRGSKPTTPTGGPSPSAPVSPAPSRRLHSSTVSLNTSKYSAK